MTIRTFLYTASSAGLILAASISCSKSGGGGSHPTPGGGKDSILSNIGNNIILPAYESLGVAVASLDSAISDFNSAPDNTKLANLQHLFKVAYTGWESVSEYNGFGPAYSNQPVLSGLNLFPTNTDTIENNITAGDFNVNAFANAAAKGFPALDYLLFGYGNGELTAFTSDPKASNRKQYLAAVSSDIRSEVSRVVNGWQPSGGNFLNTFVNGTGNSVSSSLGLLINSMVQDFEIMKNDRLGIPLGKQPPGQTLPVLPNEVEGYYSGISSQLMLTQLRTVQTLYLGAGAAGGNGNGLQNYLITIKAQYNGGQLSDTIKYYFAQAVTQMQAITDPFSVAIQANPAPADAEYATVQQLVVLLKTDMPSSLGVLITYGDNDGD